MAEIREVRLVDDLDGSEASHTVDFMIDGRAYEIDLSEDNYEKLMKALEAFAAAARPVKPVKASPKGKRDQEAALSRRTYLEAVRTWCKVHGVQVAGRGRIPGPILEAYEAGKPELLKAEETSVDSPKEDASTTVVPLFKEADDTAAKKPKKASAK